MCGEPGLGPGPTFAPVCGGGTELCAWGHTASVRAPRGGLQSFQSLRGNCELWLLERQAKRVAEVEVLVAQSCPTLCNPMDCSPPGSSVHGTLQARILEWLAISSSRGSSQPGDRIQVSCIAGGFFPIRATRQALVGMHAFFPWSLCSGKVAVLCHTDRCIF